VHVLSMRIFLLNKQKREAYQKTASQNKRLIEELQTFISMIVSNYCY